MTEHNRDTFEIAFVMHVCGIDAEAAKRKVEWLNGEGLLARHSAAYNFAYCQQSTNDAWWAWQEAQTRIMDALDRMTDQRDQLAAQLKDATSPEGWQLVPARPTKAMREAFYEAHEEWESGGLDSPDHQWGAMLAAAPKPEGQ